MPGAPPRSLAAAPGHSGGPRVPSSWRAPPRGSPCRRRRRSSRRGDRAPCRRCLAGVPRTRSPAAVMITRSAGMPPRISASRTARAGRRQRRVERLGAARVGVPSSRITAPSMGPTTKPASRSAPPSGRRDRSPRCGRTPRRTGHPRGRGGARRVRCRAPRPSRPPHAR